MSDSEGNHWYLGILWSTNMADLILERAGLGLFNYYFFKGKYC